MKYLCKNCKNEVQAESFEEIVQVNKLCPDCFSKIQRDSIRKDSKKPKKHSYYKYK